MPTPRITAPENPITGLNMQWDFLAIKANLRSLFRFAADVTRLWARGPTTVKITSDVTSTSTSFADVTALSFSVSASADYIFCFFVLFQTAATTTGIALSVNGPASPTAITYQTRIPTSLTATTDGMARAYNSGTASSGVDTASDYMIAEISGIIRNGVNAGTLIARFATEVSGSQVTIKAGSAGLLYQL